MIKIFNYYLTIEPIRKSQVLLLDDNYAKLKFNNFSYYFVDLKKFNLWIMPFMIMNISYFFRLKMSLKNLYFLTLLDLTKAKIVISHNINGLAYKFKTIKNSITTIVYQHSYIYRFEEKIYKKKFKNSTCDYFLSYDKTQTKLFSKYINAKFLELGSLKNNEIKIKKIKKNKKKNFLFISEFRIHNSNLHNKAIIMVLKNLKKYCLKKNIIPKIALNSIRADKKYLDKDLFFEKELLFYKKHLGKFSYEKKLSYDLAANSNLIISMGSNLGYELLSRKFKVIFTNTLGFLNKKFIPTYFEKKKPSFMLKNQKYYHFEEIINNILYMPDKKWKNTIQSFEYKIPFDKGNNKLNQLIRNLIKF